MFSFSHEFMMLDPCFDWNASLPQQAEYGERWSSRLSALFESKVENDRNKAPVERRFGDRGHCRDSSLCVLA